MATHVRKSGECLLTVVHLSSMYFCVSAGTGELAEVQFGKAGSVLERWLSKLQHCWPKGFWAIPLPIFATGVTAKL